MLIIKLQLEFAVVVTPTVELNALAMKRGEPTVYSFLVPTKPGSNLPSPLATSTQSTVSTNVQDQQKSPNNESSNSIVNNGITQNTSSKSISQLYNQK